ncbi:hypothetical protein Ae201684P_004375 [Aphanomyces euteiches]|uniref:Uncharacterized protein n=1 Tax=Aphanomyces euteiches TaxID=100861 RepID=A0A6G0W6E4_9STRA|nr:hypothetical protein Ae201684_018257 [Aphanomyces euteiches]KAH9068673.1 hypothetical protein Ae201684P_004375 [Aphanomyces euteiches]KAH9143181.1 hypothetical protein AeRB84_012785 [Aphanomyces euteiches]
MSDRTLPPGRYYNEQDLEPASIQARRAELDGLVYDDDTEVMDVSGMETVPHMHEGAYTVPNVPASAPAYVMTTGAEPRTAIVSQVHDQSVLHQEVHHHYLMPNPVITGERSVQEEQILAQAVELARKSAESESMVKAGHALEEQLRQTRSEHEAQAMKADQLANQLREAHAREHVEKIEARKMAELKERMEVELQALQKRDIEREAALERERVAWSERLRSITAPVNVVQQPLAPSGTSQTGSAVPMLSGFPAPKAPRYTGYTIEARRTFARQYVEYMNECAQVAVSIGIKIGIRPIRTCIDAKAKQFAAMMHLNKAPDDVSNAEWNKYFEDALNHHGPDYGDLEAKIRSSVTMDERELDPDRCFDKWVYNYWNLLEKNNMMSFHSRHPKNVVKALLEGIRPAALKAVIRSRLELDQKHLRNSVLQFMAYVKTKLVAHLEFVRATKASGIGKFLRTINSPRSKNL